MPGWLSVCHLVYCVEMAKRIPRLEEICYFCPSVCHAPVFEGHFVDLLTVVTLCAQLARDLLAVAKFFVII